ncbi:MAG: ChbG/HpnK family deacetylase [Acidobacteria bacterium]|nr:ChbG/HpnK family deacetylase [Acidobacteriota bacterium]
MRRLIVNADDFGFTNDVNEGIIEAHHRGILTATTLMATGGAFQHAVIMAKESPELDVGVHLTLVGTRALSRPERALPPTVRGLVGEIALGTLDVFKEMEAQLMRVVNAGLIPTHFDTHKHTHLHPRVLDATLDLAAKYGIRWVRRPFDLPLPAEAVVPARKRWTARAMTFRRGAFDRRVVSRGIWATDHFAGFQVTGRIDTALLSRILAAVPDGVTEFMCHPGRCGTELLQAQTRLKESRARELAALCAVETKEALRNSGVILTRYRDLSR